MRADVACSLMDDWISLVWPVVFTLLHLLGSVAVTLHAILRTRQSKAAMAWIGLAWMAPLLGSIAYACLGINRIERKGEALGFEEVRLKAGSYGSRPEDLMKLRNLARNNPSIIGMARLGKAVTGRRLLMGNQVDPLVNGDEAYPAMLEAIRGAENSVSLMSYIFDSDRVGEQFLDELVAARDRGVEVRVLIDHVGSRYSKPTMVARLREVGIEVAAFLPTGRIGMFRFANLRNHRKILVVDGRVGFTGGTNIREGHCMELKPSFPVQCLHFRVKGPVVAHLQEAFATDWAFTTGERLEKERWFHPVGLSGSVGARGVSDGPDEDLDKMAEMILGALACATKRVRIVTPYFLPDETIQWALVVAAMRGVKVDIVLPGRNNIRPMDWASMPQMPFLLQKGCRIYRSPEPFDHTKLMVVDRVWSLIGSTNWDARSLRLNFEYNIECYDEELAGRLDKVVEDKMAAAREVTLEELKERSTMVRLRDGLAQFLSPYL